MAIRIEQDGDDCLVWIKVVPGASRSQVAGTLGERLKVRVAAPAEAGKANAAACELLAHLLGKKRIDVTMETGHTHPEKTVRVRHVRAAQIIEAIRY